MDVGDYKESMEFIKNRYMVGIGDDFYSNATLLIKSLVTFVRKMLHCLILPSLFTQAGLLFVFLLLLMYLLSLMMTILR